MFALSRWLLSIWRYMAPLKHSEWCYFKERTSHNMPGGVTRLAGFSSNSHSLCIDTGINSWLTIQAKSLNWTIIILFYKEKKKRKQKWLHRIFSCYCWVLNRDSWKNIAWCFKIRLSAGSERFRNRSLSQRGLREKKSPWSQRRRRGNLAAACPQLCRHLHAWWCV